MKKSSRLIAFEILYKILQDDSYSNIAVDSMLGKNQCSDSDKSFVTALVYGVIERKLTLEYIISSHLKNKAKPKVRVILLMGAYQILFMDKVPSSAAVNESVELAKIIKQEYYCPLINAVLHKIDGERALIENTDDLSVKYSVPQHLLGMWNKAYGKEKVSSFLPFVNGKAPLFAVPNPIFTDAAKLSKILTDEGTDCEEYGDLVKINGTVSFHNSKAFNDGLFHIQDISCYRCCRALQPNAEETVLDVCAAPGGKSFTIAGLRNNQGNIYSFDIHSHRVKLIEDGAKRLGFSCINTDIQDASVVRSDMPLADKILCDVPCSGFGIIRRKPEIRYKNLDTIKELPLLQKRILSVSAGYLKQGGRLVYSTCTLNKRENENVVSDFLSSNSDYRLLDSVTSFPSEEGNDGFYYAVIERIK